MNAERGTMNEREKLFSSSFRVPRSSFVFLDRRAAGVLHRASFRFAFQFLCGSYAFSKGRLAVGARGGRIFEKVTAETTELKFPSRIDSISEAAAAAADVARRYGFSDDALFGIDMAVREAVTNAVLHGNRQDESKTVEVGLTNTSAGLVITVGDEGTGFDPSAVPDPTAEQNLLKTSGRGILFMRSFMDEVGWEHRPGGGTLVRMLKKR